MNDENDELDGFFDGIFDHLTPDDFARETSARTEVPRTNRGADAYNQFVEEQLRAVRTAWLASQTWMQPLGVVANHEKQRIFIPDEDETLRQFVHRMHREAVAMGAIWTFIAKRSMVANLGNALEVDRDIDASDPEAFRQAEAEGLVRLGVLWYAERREGAQRQHRHGQMQDEDGTLGELFEGAPNQAIPLFAEILGD